MPSLQKEINTQQYTYTRKLHAVTKKYIFGEIWISKKRLTMFILKGKNSKLYKRKKQQIILKGKKQQIIQKYNFNSGF